MGRIQDLETELRTSIRSKAVIAALLANVVTWGACGVRSCSATRSSDYKPAQAATQYAQNSNYGVYQK